MTLLLIIAVFYERDAWVNVYDVVCQFMYWHVLVGKVIIFFLDKQAGILDFVIASRPVLDPPRFVQWLPAAFTAGVKRMEFENP